MIIIIWLWYRDIAIHYMIVIIDHLDLVRSNLSPWLT